MEQISPVYNELTVLVRSSKQYKKELHLDDGVVTVIGVKAKGGFSSALSGIKAELNCCSFETILFFELLDSLL